MRAGKHPETPALGQHLSQFIGFSQFYDVTFLICPDQLPKRLFAGRGKRSTADQGIHTGLRHYADVGASLLAMLLLAMLL